MTWQDRILAILGGSDLQDTVELERQVQSLRGQVATLTRQKQTLIDENAALDQVVDEKIQVIGDLVKQLEEQHATLKMVKGIMDSHFAVGAGDAGQ